MIGPDPSPGMNDPRPPRKTRAERAAQRAHGKNVRRLAKQMEQEPQRRKPGRGRLWLRFKRTLATVSVVLVIAVAGIW